MSRIAIAGLLVVCLTVAAVTTQHKTVQPKPGVTEVQVPFASLHPSATLKIGRTADWVLVTDDAIWVTSTKPYSLQRIDPATNTVVARVGLPGEACSGSAFGFGSVWVPVCGKKPLLARVDTHTNRITSVLPIGPGGPEEGITASRDSIWIVTDRTGSVLSRIDPATNNVRQKISIPTGSYNPRSSGSTIWITGFERNILTAVDAASGKVLASIPVGPKPRFLTSGGGSVWTLNQGDGSVTRVNLNDGKVIATIPVGIRGTGGEISYGADLVWATSFDVPLSVIDTKTNKVLRQWVGRGGDSLGFGHESIWLTDYYRGFLWRIPFKAILPVVEPGAAQQAPVPMEEEPHHHVLLKNQFIEVIRATIAPGESTLFHTHSHDSAGVELAKDTSTEQLLGNPEGPPSTSQAGEVWADSLLEGRPYTHRIHNVGDGPVDVFDVEFLQKPKQPFAPATVTVAAENRDARVYKWVLAPGGTSAKHAHERPYLIVAVTSMHLKMTALEGKSFVENVKPGDFHWVDSKVTHVLTNEGAAEGQIVEIELK